MTRTDTQQQTRFYAVAISPTRKAFQKRSLSKTRPISLQNYRRKPQSKFKKPQQQI